MSDLLLSVLAVAVSCLCVACYGLGYVNAQLDVRDAQQRRTGVTR